MRVHLIPKIALSGASKLALIYSLFDRNVNLLYT